MRVNLPSITVIKMAFYDEVKTSSGAYKYYVNGQWLESKSGKTQAIMNPSTNQPVYHVQGVARSIGPPRACSSLLPAAMRCRCEDQTWLRWCMIRGSGSCMLGGGAVSASDVRVIPR